MSSVNAITDILDDQVNNLVQALSDLNVLEPCGFSAEQAFQTAGNLADADAHGIASHGIQGLNMHVDRIHGKTQATMSSTTGKGREQ